jgi:hypothetical protein
VSSCWAKDSGQRQSLGVLGLRVQEISRSLRQLRYIVLYPSKPKKRKIMSYGEPSMVTMKATPSPVQRTTTRTCHQGGNFLSVIGIDGTLEKTSSRIQAMARGAC